MKYALAQVRAQDPDRFHLAMTAPAQVQEGWLALAAFNLEIARTANRVTDPNLGLIRLQWWQEVLDEIEGGGPIRGHQVAQALAKFRDQLDFDILRDLVTSRHADLAEGPFTDIEQMRAYLRQSAGSLLIAQSRFLNVAGVESMANHLGCAFGFVGVARAIAGGGIGKLRLPALWLDDVSGAIFEATGQAAMHLDRANELRRKATHFEATDSKALSCIFAMGSLVRWWLKIFDRTENPLGQARFSRPLPFQALRLGFVRP